MGFLDILLVILIVTGIICLIVAITVLLRLRKVLDSVQTELVSFRKELSPLLLKLHRVADEAEQSLAVVSRNGDTITSAVQLLRRMVDHVYHLHDVLYQQIAPSAVGLASTLAGLRRGLQTFLDRLREPN